MEVMREMWNVVSPFNSYHMVLLFLCNSYCDNDNCCLHMSESLSRLWRRIFSGKGLHNLTILPKELSTRKRMHLQNIIAKWDSHSY